MRVEIKLAEKDPSPRFPGLYQHKDTGALAIMLSDSLSTYSGFHITDRAGCGIGSPVCWDRARCKRVLGSVTLTFDD